MSQIRFSYRVTGVAKFLSHLDLLKYFSKSLRRAGLPVAYSEGFNPHPRIAFGPPRPVAVEGWCEYCDVILNTEISATDFVAAFNAALPANIKVLDAKVIEKKIKPLQAAINLAVYTVVWQSDIDMAVLKQRCADFLQADTVPYLRHNPLKGDKTIDLRPAVADLSVIETNGQECLQMELKFLPQGSVKPTELSDYLLGAVPVIIYRNGLYIWEDGKKKEPWQ